MIDLFTELRNFTGRFSGVGTNHAGEKFVGKLELTELFCGKGFQIIFFAHAAGNPEAIFHSEVSTIALNVGGRTSLFNFNTNTPFLAEHNLTSSEEQESCRRFIFSFGDKKDRKSFREEVRLELMNDGRIGYHYFWGMPDDDFAYRSGLVMDKLSDL